MRQFRFIGDPKDYNFDFPLIRGMIYDGNKIAFTGATIIDLISDSEAWINTNDEKAKEDAKIFLLDWEEVTDEV